MGLERQYKNKTAGFRTIILICLGSTIFTMISQRAGQGVNINLVTGVGFIGAGVIFKDNISVNGLTTAAVIWVAAAIGMANGSGNYMLAIISTFVTLLVLILFHVFEAYLDKINHEKLLSLVFDSEDHDNLLIVEDMIKKHTLNSKEDWSIKRMVACRLSSSLQATKSIFQNLDEKLLAMPAIKIISNSRQKLAH